MSVRMVTTDKENHKRSRDRNQLTEASKLPTLNQTAAVQVVLCGNSQRSGCHILAPVHRGTSQHRRLRHRDVELQLTASVNQIIQLSENTAI